MQDDLTIKNGTISFWVDHKVFINGDRVLLSINPTGGSISFYIQSSQLKVAFVQMGSGRADLTYQTNLASPDSQRHMIALTWNFLSGLILYVDGVQVSSASMPSSVGA